MPKKRITLSKPELEAFEEETKDKGALLEAFNQINRKFTDTEIRAICTLNWNTDKMIKLREDVELIKRKLKI